MSKLTPNTHTNLKTMTCRKPLYPPSRIITGFCEGIEPLRMSEYVRRIQPGHISVK